MYGLPNKAYACISLRFRKSLKFEIYLLSSDLTFKVFTLLIKP